VRYITFFSLYLAGGLKTRWRNNTTNRTVSGGKRGKGISTSDRSAVALPGRNARCPGHPDGLCWIRWPAARVGIPRRARRFRSARSRRPWRCRLSRPPSSRRGPGFAHCSPERRRSLRGKRWKTLTMVRHWKRCCGVSPSGKPLIVLPGLMHGA